MNIETHGLTRRFGRATAVRGVDLSVVVSDSGDGLLETLRPSIAGSPLAALSDQELVVHMLNEGVSRLGPERGIGLRRSAEVALRYRAELSVPLPTSELLLGPRPEGGYAQGTGRGTAYGTNELPRLRGTHLAFRFHLDNPL